LDPNNTIAISQLYRVLPDQRKSEALPYIEAYLKNADSNYNVYKAVGLRLLGTYHKKLGDEPKANEYFNQANKLFPVENTTQMNDWDPPLRR
jgi:Tfp pilus assembly protein PilF